MLCHFSQPFRQVALYWAGSLGHSMIVFMIGNVIGTNTVLMPHSILFVSPHFVYSLTGKFGIRWSVLLNVPYIFIPFLCGGRFLNERPKYFLQDPQVSPIFSLVFFCFAC